MTDNKPPSERKRKMYWQHDKEEYAPSSIDTTNERRYKRWIARRDKRSEPT